MPEGANIEVAHHLSDHGHDGSRRRSGERWIEIVEVVILAVVAVATAWSGYQAARWDGRQSFLYGTSSHLRFDADSASTAGGQALLFDAQTFNSWLQAHLDGDHRLASLYVGRFSHAYRVAFDAWLKLDPLTVPGAPSGPRYMPEYHNPQTEHAAELDAEASSLFDEGTEARETADRYVRQTVLFATVLFLVALSQRFKDRGVKIAASAIAAVLLIVALVGVVSLPRI